MKGLRFPAAGDDLDAEHRELVGFIVRYSAAARRGADKAELVSLFEQVLDYARAHLHEEEALMARVQYPGLEQHLKAHQHLLGGISELLLKLRAADDCATVPAEQFLLDWLTLHFEKSDRPFYEFMQQRQGDVLP